MLTIPSLIVLIYGERSFNLYPCRYHPPAPCLPAQQARRRSSLSRLGGEGGPADGKGGPVPRITLATVLGPTFSLEDALSLELHKHVEACMEAVEVATKELKVETRLRNIEDRWKEEQLGFVRHRDTEVFVLFGADEVLEALEDHQMQLQGMAGMGKFVDFFRQEVKSAIFSSRSQHLPPAANNRIAR